MEENQFIYRGIIFEDEATMNDAMSIDADLKSRFEKLETLNRNEMLELDNHLDSIGKDYMASIITCYKMNLNDALNEVEKRELGNLGGTLVGMNLEDLNLVHSKVLAANYNPDNMLEYNQFFEKADRYAKNDKLEQLFQNVNNKNADEFKVVEEEFTAIYESGEYPEDLISKYTLILNEAKYNLKLQAVKSSISRIPTMSLEDIVEFKKLLSEINDNNLVSECLVKAEHRVDELELAILDEKCEGYADMSVYDLENLKKELATLSLKPSNIRSYDEKITVAIKENTAKELEVLCSNINQLTKEELALLLKQLNTYTNTDLVQPYFLTVVNRINDMEIQYLNFVCKGYESFDAAKLQSLISSLKAQNLKPINVNPYIEKLTDKLVGAEESLITDKYGDLAQYDFNRLEEIQEEIKEMNLSEALLEKYTTKIEDLKIELKNKELEKYLDYAASQFTSMNLHLSHFGVPKNSPALANKVNQATRVYAQNRMKYELPLILMDGGGDDGFFMTLNGLYSKAYPNSPITIRDIRNVTYTKKLLNFVMLIQTSSEEFAIPFKCDKNQIVNAISVVRNLVTFINTNMAAAPSSVICKECGVRMPATSHFCPNCGKTK